MNARILCNRVESCGASKSLPHSSQILILTRTRTRAVKNYILYMAELKQGDSSSDNIN